eukprot:TRINITY_DN1505_c0_g1_i1.p1 TRINITY_DN1505_c0_g1~~TRINITY_DN1505_c0_g1_i1.p1  ORF type:complete len:555 (+),score=172.81 TRINITY_DN1505_c0_g1_i1:150-1814(+)
MSQSAAENMISTWKVSIHDALEARNSRHGKLHNMIKTEMKLRKQNIELRDECKKAKLAKAKALEDVAKMRQDLSSARLAGNQAGVSASSEKVKALEAEVGKLNADLLKQYQHNNKLLEREADATRQAKDMKAQVARLEQELEEAHQLNASQANDLTALHTDMERQVIKVQTLADELAALQMQFTVTDRDYQQAIKERDELVERIVEVKQQQVDLQNSLNESHEKKKQARVAAEIQEASQALPDIDVQLNTSVRTGLPDKAVHRLNGHSGDAYVAAWDMSSHTFATGGRDSVIKLWNKAGHCKSTLTSHHGSITDIDFHINCDALVSASNDKSLGMWQLKTGRCLHKMTGHSDHVYAARYLESNKVVSCSQDRTLRVWNATRGVSEITYMVPSTGLSLVCHSGSRFVSLHFDKKLREWDVRQRSKKAVREGKSGHTENVYAMAMDLAGERALVSSKDGAITIIDLLTLDVLKTLPSDGFEGCPCKPCWSPDGRHIAQGTNSGEVLLWDVTKGSVVKTLSSGGHTGPVTCLAWSRDNDALLSTGKDGKVVIWQEEV